MRGGWHGVHWLMVGSWVVVSVLIIHVGVVIVWLISWWWGASLKHKKKNHKAQNLIQQKLSFTSSEERKMPFASKTNLHLIKLLSHYHKKFTEPEV